MTATEHDLLVRRAEPEDAPALAGLYTAARVAAVPMMPAARHTGEEDRAWMTARLAGTREAWLAEREGELLGYALLERDWLDHLFVRPDRTGQGVGTLLLDVVKSLRPGGFCLWVFESNTRARLFYTRHGLLELERTDGSSNEEQAPDIRMVWPGTDPIGYLRSLIDEVDHDLALLLARRAALTGAVQQVKPVPGPAGRDQDRERQIAERMAGLVPALGVDRLQRIMHTIIGESLDALD